MKLKRINAVLGLITTACLFAHAGYSAFCYITFYYNPVMKYVFAVPVAVFASLHAVCGMLSVFMLPEGTRMDLYADLNRDTLIQRVSAALIFPLLIIHLYTFRLVQMSSSGEMWAFWLILLLQAAFYAAVFIHVSVSVSRAFITLGVLSSIEKQKRIDRVMKTVCAVCFIICIISVCRGQIIMFGG